MKQDKGVTLIELLITISVIGILFTIAIPTYQGYMRKQQREVAKGELLRLAQSQMKWRITHSAFAAVDTLGTQSIKNFTYSDDSPASTSDFSIKASATGSQIDDLGCTELKITKSGLITPASC